MTKKISLVSILLAISVVCFSALFMISTTNNAVAETTSQSSVTYDFTNSTDSAAFVTMQKNGWAVTDGKFAPVDSGVQNDASATKLNKVLDLSNNQKITFDLYVAEPVVEFGLLDSSAANIWGSVKIVRYCVIEGTPCLTLSSYIDNSSGWIANNVSLGNITGAVKSVEISTQNGSVSFSIGGTVVHTADFSAAGAYLIFRATSTQTYIDNLKVEKFENQTTETGSTDDNVIDFNIASDADLFTAAGSGGWAISSNKYYPVAGWAVSCYSKKIDLTKNSSIILNFSPATDEEQFNIALRYSSTEGENDGVGISVRSMADGSKTVWLDTKFGGEGGWQGESLINLCDGLKHTLQITIENKKVSFAIDGVNFVCQNKVSELTATSDTAYLAFQAAKVSSYVDNVIIRNSLDFCVASDADLFGAAGGGGWKISDGETLVPNQGWAVSYYKKAIDATKNQVITLDFNAATDETQFNIGLRSSYVEDQMQSAGISVRTMADGSKTVWLDNNFGSGWVAERAGLDYIDGVQRKLSIVINNKNVSFYVDGVKLIAYAGDAVISSVTAPADTVYLSFQATSASSCVDNIAFTENAKITVKDISDASVKTENAVGEYVLPELTAVGKKLLGYNVGGKLLKAGSAIFVDKDVTLTAVFATFETQNGASIRINEPTGLRFRSYIDKATVDYLTELGVELVVGTLIAKAGDVSEEGAVNVNKLTLESTVKKLNIVKTAGGESVEGENLYFNAAIVSIKSSHYAWNFTARAYLTVTFADGETLTVYTDGHTASVSEVANEALNDENANWGDTEKEILQGFIVSGTNLYVSLNGDDNNNGGSFHSAVATLEKALELTDSKKKQ